MQSPGLWFSNYLVADKFLSNGCIGSASPISNAINLPDSFASSLVNSTLRERVGNRCCYTPKCLCPIGWSDWVWGCGFTSTGIILPGKMEFESCQATDGAKHTRSKISTHCRRSHCWCIIAIICHWVVLSIPGKSSCKWLLLHNNCAMLLHNNSAISNNVHLYKCNLGFY